MPRGTTLSECLEMLRFEAGHSPSRALGKNVEPSLRNLLRRTQMFLWADYPWDFLEVERLVPMQAGGRYYAFPADLDGTRIRSVSVRWSALWSPMCYGITDVDYNAQDPAADQRNVPVIKWGWRKNIEQDPEPVSAMMFEVWPLPGATAAPPNLEHQVKFEGVRTLKRFTQDNDVCDLDDQLIVLFAAAKLLGRQKLADGQEAQAAASTYYARMRGQTHKSPMFVLGGATDGFEEREHEIWVSYAKAVPGP
jgi:hypothetical protein